MATFYADNDGFVRFRDETTLEWYQYNGPGDEKIVIVPIAGAAEYFEKCGREDIAKLIRARQNIKRWK